MAISELAEKPDGARNVVSWDVVVRRDFHPVYTIPGKRFGYELGSAHVNVQIGVVFDDDESAREFEAKVRALLPEVPV